MSGATESLARKISGATDLEGVVRSMKALAASSIGQYERAVDALDDYFRTVELGLSLCLRASDPRVASPGRRTHARTSRGLVIFGSDQGLVGRFNEAIVACVKKQEPTGGVPYSSKIWVVGERARALFVDMGFVNVQGFSAPNAIAAIAGLVAQLLTEVETAFARAEVDEVLVLHNRPTGASSYATLARPLLPLDGMWHDRLVALPWPAATLPQVLGRNESTLAVFIHEYLFVQLFQACAESLASENASRLAAMERAERNISELLEGLNRTYHRVRQESIDEELFDVISGSEALTQAPPG